MTTMMYVLLVKVSMKTVKNWQLSWIDVKLALALAHESLNCLITVLILSNLKKAMEKV